MAKQKQGWPRNPISLWTGFRFFLFSALVLQLLIAAVQSYELFAGVITSETEASLTLIGVGLVGLILFVLWAITLLLCVVYTCRITYRLLKNLHAMEAPGEIMSPAWAVGWYFIPLANLVMPLRGIQQAWRGTFALSDQLEPNDGVIVLWWLTWIVGNVASNISFRMSLAADAYSESGPSDPALYLNSLYLAVAGCLLGAVSCWFMIKTFGPIVHAQDELIRARPATPD
jgi:hypothetical protein